jgi:hypothetical protein
MSSITGTHYETDWSGLRTCGSVKGGGSDGGGAYGGVEGCVCGLLSVSRDLSYQSGAVVAVAT